MRAGWARLAATALNVTSGSAAGPSAAALTSTLYVLAITAAEVLVALVDARLGVPLHVVVLLSLLLHGSRSPLLQQRLYWSLALGPLIRIMSLSLPLVGLPLIWWYALISVPLLLATAVTIHVLGYRPAEVGLRFLPAQLPLHVIVALVGAPLGIIEYLILQPAPLVSDLSLGAIWLPALVLLVSTGFMEEIVFRGLLQRAAQDAIGRTQGPVLATALFAVLHIGYKSWIDLLFVFLAGGLFAYLAARSGSIWGVTLAHGLVNAVLFLIGPFVLGGPIS